MNYTKVIKLLYLADRESLAETGEPMTGDEPVVMDNGPVLSRVYDCLKPPEQTEGLPQDRRVIRKRWEQFFRTDGHDLVLETEPGEGALCQYETEKLADIWDRNKDKTCWDLIDETHELPEVKCNKPRRGGRRPILLRHILQAIGLDEAQAQDIEGDAREAQRFATLFGG